MARAGLLPIVLAACAEHGQTPIDASDPCTQPPVQTPMLCKTAVRYDWNDGSTQGWSASSGAFNFQNTLAVSNQGNGSLQVFGPNENSSYLDTDVLSFTLKLDNYTSVSSPAELTTSNLRILTPAGNAELFFMLDVSGLCFGKPHVFELPVSTGVLFGTVTRAEFLAGTKIMTLNIMEPSLESSMANATLDDWVVGTSEGCPP